MPVERDTDTAAASVAAAIGEPARARMLYCLLDNRARTSTELATIAEVSASTASIHLSRLASERLVRVAAQGRHRYYSLNGPKVARVLEGLSVLAGRTNGRFVPNTPEHLRAGRTCYDHIAGALGVALHDRIVALDWFRGSAYEITSKGGEALEGLGLDLETMRRQRRKLAFGCLDWSERRCHLGGAIGAELLNLVLKRGWVTRHLDSRALEITRSGRREMFRQFGIQLTA